MIAQCTSCGHTFETETWGVQVCPNCGTRVMLDPPPDEPEVVPGPDAEQTAGEVQPPFEDPSYGFLEGYFETWKQSLFQPTEFFSRLPVDDAGKAFLYAWLTQVVGGEIAMLWSFLQMQAQRGLMANLPGGAPPETAQLLKTMSWVYGGAGFILVPLFAVLGHLPLRGDHPPRGHDRRGGEPRVERHLPGGVLRQRAPALRGDPHLRRARRRDSGSWSWTSSA